ncbi:Ankyrin repeat-containing domain protein, partial [Metarhizium majus ARSEF 297]
MDSQDKDPQEDEMYVWPSIAAKEDPMQMEPLAMTAARGQLEAFCALFKRPEYNSEESRSLALLGAASGGCTEIAHKLIEAGVDTALMDENGNMALHLSAEKQHTGIMKLLLDKRYKHSGNFDINAKNGSRKTALHLATESGKSLSVQLLLEHDANVDAATSTGETALHIAASLGHVEVMRKLLAARAEDYRLCRGNKNGRNVLTLAVQKGHTSIVEMLLETGINPKKIQSFQENALVMAAKHLQNGKDMALLFLLRGWNVNVRVEAHIACTALHAAALVGNAPVVKLLLDVGAKHRVGNSQGKQPLHLAVERGDGEVVKMLLSKGADIDATDKQNASPLLLIVSRKDTKMLEMVLESHPGVDIGSKQLPTERTVLQECCFNPEATKLLLERGANAMTRSNSNAIHAVFRAAGGDGAETVRLYLDAGFQPDWTRDDGGSILDVAAFYGQLATVQLLVERGADVKAADKKGTAPIHRAAMRDTPEIVEYLLHQGANLEEMSDDYGTPLMAAAWQDKTETVKFLLGQKANVNATSTKSCRYYTALQAAVERNSPTMVGILLEQGADVNLARGRSSTALCAAIRKGSIDITKLLVEAKADVGSKRGMPERLAIQKNRRDILEILVEHGVDPGRPGRRLLEYPWMWSRSSLERLLRKYPDVNHNARDSAGRTLLIVAVRHRMCPDILLEHPTLINRQDHRGQTALIYAIRRRDRKIVQRLLEAGGDPLSGDVRGRDALYWAALRGDADIFGTVFRQVDKLAQTKSSFVLAINAAAAAGQADFVKELLAKIMTDSASTLALADSNGWSALYTAEQYDKPEIVGMIRHAMLGVPGGSQGAPPLLKAPTEWHPHDKSFSLVCEPDALSLSVAGIARANHPMVPTRDGVYYFEVTIVNEGRNSSLCKRFAVGFCREDTPLGSGADSSRGAWWYHGRNGHFGEQMGYENPNRGPTYGEGDVIGCGVNFKHGTAFYTKNGEIIEYMASGLVFQNLQGRLYPAVMVHAQMAGFEFKAQFCEEGADETAGFRFKGPYTDEKTFLKYQQGLDIRG